MTIQYADLPDRDLNPNKGVLHPSTVAALKFQDACLLDNWADFARTYEVLRRMAESRFPRRGDAFDVLDDTIDEYGLWRDANPRGFWTAFTRNMIDAQRSAYNATSGPLELFRRCDGGSDGNSDQWVPTAATRTVDHLTGQEWRRQQTLELHAAEATVDDKWKIAQASVHEIDRRVCQAVDRLTADDSYMDELDRSEGATAKLNRLVVELCSVADCSPATAYRELRDFRNRYSSAKTKLNRHTFSLRKTASSLAMLVRDKETGDQSDLDIGGPLKGDF